MPSNAISTSDEPLADPPHEVRPPAAVGVRRFEMALLLVAGVFFGLHFVHLRADFPTQSPWMDWAKYTDEGWYGDAAVRHYQRGHWNVPGDFNPAAALPAWPLVEMAVFRFTGVSMVAARALTVIVFGLILTCSFQLIRGWPACVERRWDHGPTGRSAATLRAPSLAPTFAVLLLAVSPFCFVFMRMAILEPFLILLTLMALLVARPAGEAGWMEMPWRELAAVGRPWSGIGWAVALGLILTCIVLTKTTGVFLLPSICWLLWAATGYRIRIFAKVTGLACAIAVLAWLSYYAFFVRPHYLADYRYLFSANAYTGATLATIGTILHDTLVDGSWMGATLFILSLMAIVASLLDLTIHRSQSHPLATSLVLWALGYGAFVAYHANLQPRYYLVPAIPMTLLVAIGLDALLASAASTGEEKGPGGARLHSWFVRMAAVAGSFAVLFAAVNDARHTLHFVRHPEYTFFTAARRIHDAIDREVKANPGHSRLLLSISGSDISLMTGIPSICDDFGTMELPDRVATYKPGWFAAWNDVEDDKMEALAPLFRLVKVGAFPAYDDPERNLLILYRLDPLNSPWRRGRAGRRRSLVTQKRQRSRVAGRPQTSPAKP